MISTCDPADLPEFHTDENPCDHNLPGHCENCGQGGDLICPHCKSLNVRADDSGQHADSLKILERFRRLLLDAMERRNSKYWLGIILIATGDPAAEGISMVTYAADWGVTKAAVSKHCVEVCVSLGIKPSRWMRSESARESYRLHNVRRS